MQEARVVMKGSVRYFMFLTFRNSNFDRAKLDINPL